MPHKPCVVRVGVNNNFNHTSDEYQQLEGFAKVMLAPGQTRLVHIELPASSFRYWSPATHAWTLLPGPYTVEVAASSRDIQLQKSVMVTGK